MLPPILQEIQRHTQEVEEKKIRCELSSCPQCGQAASFTLHDRRRRSFFVILGRLVKKVVSLLSRHKCGHCGGTFTLYPRFALPRKRYLCPDILEHTERYVEDDPDLESYRSAVKVERMAVFHEGEGEKIDERSLSHTTLYRWFAFLAALESTRRKALELVRQKAPSSEIFRKVLPIAPRKYRSDERRRLLADTRRLLQVEREYRRLLGDSIFPRLATLCSFT